MLKYVDTKVTFSEIPDEIALCINLSNCPCKCENCHSSYLAEDIGEVLTITRIEKLIKKNKGITAICFMGGDSDPKLINHYARLIKNERVPIRVPIDSSRFSHFVEYVQNPLKVCWYSGKDSISSDINLSNFDYIKVGRYIEERGPLNKQTTNQILYHIIHTSTGINKLYDVTYKFWKNEA